MRLRVRPRLLRVLFMRKEKHRSVGASGFFLDRPEEGRGVGGRGRRGREGAGEGGAGHRVQGPVPSSTPVTKLFPVSSSKSRPETREGLQGYATLFKMIPPRVG